MSKDKQHGPQNTKLWGGRYAGEQDALFERLHASIGFDYVLAPYDIQGSRVHVRMLAKIGVLTQKECDEILGGLEQVAKELQEGSFRGELSDEDIHMAVERRLGEVIGPVAGKLHTGRSRNDQVVLDLHLYLMDAVEGHRQGIASLMEALLVQAERNKAAVMPGYTHMQRAQPILVAHHLLAYFFALERDMERLSDWRARLQMPLGSGALAGVNYPVDREWVARELGFKRVAPNAMDAVATRDFAFTYMSVITNCALTLSRLAGEIVLWSTQEYGLASLPEGWTSGSSIMPQKRNPDGAELVRGKAAGFLGRLQGLGALVKGLPLAYNSDLQEDKPFVFASREEFDLCVAAMAAMVRTLEFDVAKGRTAAEGGYSQATDVADYLVEKGMPFREAHRVTGQLVSALAKSGRTFDSVGVEELAGFSPLFDEDYYGVVDLDRVVAGKVSPGGTSPKRVEEQLAMARKILKDIQAAGSR